MDAVSAVLSATMARRPLKVEPKTELARQRVKKGLSREALARVAGTSTTKLGKIETGQDPNPPLRILNNCALALGLKVEKLIEPEWRTWWDPHGGQPHPPDPAEFWYPGGRGLPKR